jgi:hypothetical protein
MRQETRAKAVFQKISTGMLDAARAVVKHVEPLAATTEAACERWLRDPLAHPALDAMSLSELADIPPRALRAQCRE